MPHKINNLNSISSQILSQQNQDNNKKQETNAKDASNKNNKKEIQQEKNTYTGYKTRYCSKIKEPESTNIRTRARMPLPRFGKMVP